MLETVAAMKVILLTTTSFVIAMFWTPALTHLLYKHKLGKSIRNEGKTPIFSKLHAKKAGTPTMGGVLVWGTVLFLALVVTVANVLAPDSRVAWFHFISRSETLLPLGALVAAGLIGMVDDFLNVKGIGPEGGGIQFRHRFFLYAAIASFGAYWFFVKLGWDVLHVPFYGDILLGWWYIPFFFLVLIGTAFSVNQTDGLDGLAGGTLLTSFAAYGSIAFLQGRFDLAVFCGVIIGALLAFLWFNIHPARFFMGDTGAMSLGVTLAVIAMLTNYALLLPIVGIIFVIEAASTIIQIVSKKLFKKKVFLSAPIHHHFEAKKWPESKIVMRFWVISIVAAGFGVVLALLDMAIT